MDSMVPTATRDDAMSDAAAPSTSSLVSTRWVAGLGLVVSLLLAFSAATIGGLATAQGVSEWYPTLTKPSWTPPTWVFGPVWTTLYTLMGISSWLVWMRRGVAPGVPVALGVYGIHLVVNALWSVSFFALRDPGLALLNILALDGLVIATIVLFARIRPLAAGLLVPYLLWALFATGLNLTIWRLN
jgi:benzodiazapine receptor